MSAREGASPPAMNPLPDDARWVSSEPARIAWSGAPSLDAHATATAGARVDASHSHHLSAVHRAAPAGASALVAPR